MADMKTIQERALEIYPMYNRYDDFVREEREAYIQGATEQKAIDIEKACEWLKENADNYYNASCQSDNCSFGSEQMLGDFRKAM